MTSEVTEAFVWVWLEGSVEPVVAGRLDGTADEITFQYGASYLARSERVALFLPELPLGHQTQSPFSGMHIAGCIADARPDAWGKRVILRRRFGANAEERIDHIGLLALLLESGSDRFGALDFQASSTDYIPRITHAPLEELMSAVERIEAGLPLNPDLELALLHGSSLGGARPKVLIDDEEGRPRIAKFARPSDMYPVVNAEGAAMYLARQGGLNVATTEVVHCGDADVLLVDRFDRPAPHQRRMVVSALTIQELDEQWARYATYTRLAEEIRLRFTDVRSTLRELFRRVAFNICVGNTDDHARNHAAFWDGSREMLTLTPAYDVCPQARSTGETEQAMDYGPDGERRSRLEPLVRAAPLYHLEPREAREIVEHLVEVVQAQWTDAADHGRLSATDRELLLGSQILNPSIFCTD